MDTRVGESSIKDTLVIRDFLNVFPNDILGLPPNKKIEFLIDLIPGIALISLASCRMAPFKLRELRYNCKN